MAAILVVDARVPAADFSAAERAELDFMHSCLAAGHEVAFAALEAFHDDDVRATALASEGVAVDKRTGLEHLREVVARGRWDFVIVNGYGPGVVAYTALAGADTVPILFGHDLQSVRLAGQRAVTGEVPARAEALTAVAQKRCWRTYPLAVYPARWEADHVNHVAGGNAVAMPYFRLTPADLPELTITDRRGLLMVGPSAHAPNLDAVQVAVRDILPFTDEALTVVGEWSPSVRETLQGPRVRFIGRVPEAVLRELHATHLALLAPLRFGAGTRRKLVAAMGLGLPVITTSEGVRGLLVEDATAADGVIIADQPGDVVSAIRDLRGSRFVGLTRTAQRRVREVYDEPVYDAAVAAMLERGSQARGE